MVSTFMRLFELVSANSRGWGSLRQPCRVYVMTSILYVLASMYRLLLSHVQCLSTMYWFQLSVGVARR